jgi:hypothetical protein
VGCPQRGVLSLLLWNLVVDELLAVINDQGFCAMGYADDIVIIVKGKFTHTVRELMQAALNKEVKWTTKEGLSISPPKTVVVPFTNRRNLLHFLVGNCNCWMGLSTWECFWTPSSIGTSTCRM